MAKPSRDDLRDTIRAAKLRATPSRIAVLALLQRNGNPISHADVAAKLSPEGWDPATLYRNLMDFVEAGLVRRTDVGDHVWRFELTGEKHDQSAHPHFICTACGTVECLPGFEVVVPRGAPRAVRGKRVEVHVRGLCDGCA